MSEDEARVERVAQAICIASGQDPDFNYDPSGIQRTDDVRWRMYESKARAAIAAATAWQPIETAPRDGTPMLMCRWDSNDQDVLPIVSGFWSRLSDIWFCEMAGRKVNPTHWMLLPEPPR